MNIGTENINPTKDHSERTFTAIILALGLGHLLNDVMQSMLPAIYPLLSKNYNLSLLQIGIITASFQITGSLLQPVIGAFTDKRSVPYLLPFSAIFTVTGLGLLAHAQHYYTLLLGASCIGMGSSVFHPEASRITRFAAGQRLGFAQSVFQVGGNTGTALGPLLAAFFLGYQKNLGWFAFFALVGFVLLTGVSRWYIRHLGKRSAGKKKQIVSHYSKTQIRRAIFILVFIMFAKFIYLACMNNFYIFFSMKKFGLELYQAQYLLFLYLAGIAIGTIAGGPVGDKIGTRPVIWISILGVLPFTITLPHVSLPIMALLSVIIGIILASAFPAIIVFAQEMVPGKVGTVAGLLFGFSFGIGAASSAILGALGDVIGNQGLFTVCSFLPFLGIVAVFLPQSGKEKNLSVIQV